MASAPAPQEAKRPAAAGEGGCPAKRPRAGTDSPAEEEAVRLPQLRVRSRAPTVGDLAFGASGLGCLYEDVPPERARATVEAVLQHGFGYVDTAPWYGAGLSETRLGELLDGRGDGIVLSTKCGRVIKPLAGVCRQTERVELHYIGHFITEAYHADIPVADYSAEGVRESFRQSCLRLRRERLDCLRLHDAEGEERWRAATEGGAVEAMVELRAQGLVKEIGLGMGSAEYAMKFLRRYPPGTFDSLMLACSWNLVDQDGLDVLRECQRLGVRVHNVGIFASGVLWGAGHYKYDKVPPAVVAKVEAWQALAKEHGLSLPRVALAFALLPEVVQKAAVGCSSPEQVAQNVALCGQLVPEGLWREAKARGLLADGVPLPAEH